jgi:DNA (cytosine-5)-methyltransferase 1
MDCARLFCKFQLTEMVRNMRPMTAVDLFAGAGGLSYGLRRSGFEVLKAYDNWEPAVKTYRRNVGDHIECVSITPGLDVPAADVYVGGPPCQGFSSAGLRRADDARNSLVGAFSRIVAQQKPRAFVFENVEGFLTGADGIFVFDLLEPLIEAGYRIHIRKINAANFGVPQHRKRVLAIGGLGWEPSFPKPTHAAFGAPGAHLANGVLSVPAATLDEALRSLPPAASTGASQISDHTFVELAGDDLKRAQLLEQGQCMSDLPEDLWHPSFRKRAFRRVMDGTPTERRGGAPAGLRRLRADQPSKAITGGALRDFLHPYENRPLTIRECAILQTFPSDFEFFGSQNDKIQLIGNAVPPLLAQRIAERLVSELRSASSSAGQGALLSFLPTLSAGMSPALESITRRVKRRFVRRAPHHQKLLWD